jgi:hypothetical protein
MIYDPRAILHDGEYLDLDPFGFWPTYRSRLEGIGGPDPSEDPDYVFHSLYVACGTGPIIFRVEIDGLVARRGTLILRVHELPDGIGSTARQMAIVQAQLVDLVRQKGRVMVDVEARVGNSYAILGHIYGDTVAHADELRITVTREAPDPNATNRSSTYSSTRLAVGANMVGTMAPTLIAPVSQMATELQLGERVFREACERLALDNEIARRDNWSRAFVARVLERYDFAQPGARGLIVNGLDETGLAGWLRTTGCRISLSHAGAPPEGMDDRDLVALDPHAIPETLAGYDFAVAIRTVESGWGWKYALTMIEEMLRLVKPLGLLVVTLDVLINRPGVDGDAALSWEELSRIALVLLSRGHAVAQLRRDIGDAVDDGTGTTAFGFVIRRRV